MSETNRNSGTAEGAGSLALELNPPAPEQSGEVIFDGAWVRAELDEGKLTVKVSGQASFAGRTVTQSVELTESLEPLKNALQQIINAYEPHVKQVVLGAAYEARQVAKNNGEEV